VRALSEWDIYRAANLLIRQYANQTAIEAARKADLMPDRGDAESSSVNLS